MVSLDWQNGDFVGTLVEGQTQSWSAYHKNKYLTHGHGRYLIDDTGLHFQLMHGGETFIPFSQMKAVELVKRHAGKFTAGNFITKITWQNGGRTLMSGFVLAKNDGDNARIHQQMRRYIS